MFQSTNGLHRRSPDFTSILTEFHGIGPPLADDCRRFRDNKEVEAIFVPPLQSGSFLFVLQA
jgi:hypothetical protein